ncbi:MAG: hypothetical protein EXS39_03325 [Opitutaceae bacterium]|nr:hypothetical protein [Opitutaceae bacterium]
MPAIDTKSVPSVAAAVTALYGQVFPRDAPVLLHTLFRDVETLFTGQYHDYQACDLRYHDLEHTLQVTLCFARLMAARDQARAVPVITSRQYELGLAAALLHDSGYLKLRSDATGTGAKYTYTHVMRSCAFTAAYLPQHGINLTELEGVLGAIKCTGTSLEVARLYFHSPVDRLIGYAVATADYLGQMAASDYPDELEYLYHEFEESQDYIHVPAANRQFKSARDLIERTPEFWVQVVRPKLENSFEAMYRFLADPYPRGSNPYVDAIEQNISKVRQRIQSPLQN